MLPVVGTGYMGVHYPMLLFVYLTFPVIKSTLKQNKNARICVIIFIYIRREIEIEFKVLCIRDCGPVTLFILPRIWNGA